MIHAPGASADMHVAAIDIGKPGKNLGWSMSGPRPDEGCGIDRCISALTAALTETGLVLGFEAPMFVPMREDPNKLLEARNGECPGGIKRNRPFSFGAGATALVTGLVVVPYILSKLKQAVPDATANLDWTTWLPAPKQLLLFEAFVTDQRKTEVTRHVEDARLAVEAFKQEWENPAGCRSSVIEEVRLNLLGAMMLRTGWSSDPSILREPCLVLRRDG